MCLVHLLTCPMSHPCLQGERAVVLEVTQFPVSLLDRILCVCSGVDQLSPNHFIAGALHLPSPPRPHSLLTVMGQSKKELFKEPVYLPFSWKQVWHVSLHLCNFTLFLLMNFFAPQSTAGQYSCISPLQPFSAPTD